MDHLQKLKTNMYEDCHSLKSRLVETFGKPVALSVKQILTMNKIGSKIPEVHETNFLFRMMGN